MSQDDGDEHRRAYPSRPEFRGQPLLQLPHAAHDLWVVAVHAQSSGLVAERARKRCLWPTECMQSLSSRQNPRVDCAKTSRLVQTTEPELSADDQNISAAVQWIIKGDAGQRALIAWGMGWEPAQKISGRDWLYPYLIYSLTDSYAAIRFDAWKSLQTLPGFNDFPFTYTANERALNEAASDAYAKWLQRVRDLPPPFPSESVLENDGRFRTDVFQKLRRRT